MKDKLIEEYLNRLTLKDVESFASSKGISLNSDELDIVHEHIIKNWRTVYYGNPRSILDDLNKKLNSESYNKIEQLYIQFKNYL